MTKWDMLSVKTLRMESQKASTQTSVVKGIAVFGVLF